MPESEIPEFLYRHELEPILRGLELVDEYYSIHPSTEQRVAQIIQAARDLPKEDRMNLLTEFQEFHQISANVNQFLKENF